MIKRVNSTGRRRISRNHATIEIFDGDPRTFDAFIDLQGFEALSDAAVVLEATCAGSNTICRFNWGTVGKLIPPENRELRDLYGENIFFSLKVIDRSEKIGRLLGLAENIRPLKGGAKTMAGRRGILPVERADLGDEIWQLEFRSEDVFLLVNQRVPGLADHVRFDAAIYTLIYPVIIREVLNRALDEVVDDDQEDSDHWPALWLQFGRSLHPEHAIPPEPDNDEEREEWIDQIVSAFCREHTLREKFMQATGSGEGWEDTP